MNRKERRLALRTAFQSRAGELIVVEDFGSQLSRPKTKDLVTAMTRWGIDTGAKILLIVSEKVENVYLSARNVPNIKLILSTNLNVYDVLEADAIVTTTSALASIQEVYGTD